ncbi:unnamed protein product, partial [Trichogramma brassicae]
PLAKYMQIYIGRGKSLGHNIHYPIKLDRVENYPKDFIAGFFASMCGNYFFAEEHHRIRQNKAREDPCIIYIAVQRLKACIIIRFGRARRLGTSQITHTSNLSSLAVRYNNARRGGARTTQCSATRSAIGKCAQQCSNSREYPPWVIKMTNALYTSAAASTTTTVLSYDFYRDVRTCMRGGSLR